MAAQHGGFRKGAGRPKGSRNRATIAREARQREALATARAENANLSAIDYLLQVLRDPTTPGCRWSNGRCLGQTPQSEQCTGGQQHGSINSGGTICGHSFVAESG